MFGFTSRDVLVLARDSYKRASSFEGKVFGVYVVRE